MLSTRSSSYPLVYAIQILPLSVGRWLGFVQENHDGSNHVPTTALVAVMAVYLLSGFANVVLFLFTRPNLLLFKDEDGSGWGGGSTARLNGGETDSIEGEKRRA